MLVRFWGTRGSIATPGPGTLRYGGNTACVEVRADDGTLVVLDCGTGARGLGLSLMASEKKPLLGHLLITHTHWDHIQGFPFFTPLFAPGNEWDIYAPGITGRHLEETLSGQMEYTYFPVRLDQLGVTIRYHDVVEGTFQIGSIKVTAHYLNHPALTLGYRLESGGASVVYATDHEPHSHHRLELPAGDGKVALSQPLHHEDQRHVMFMAGADLIIHDAQFTAAEDVGRIGWGHTAAEQVVDFALAAGAERLALFHHDPSHDDDALDRLVDACQNRVQREAADEGKLLEVTAAAEGESIVLSEDDKFVLRRQMTHWQPAQGDHARFSDSPALAQLNGTAVSSAEAHVEMVLVIDTPENVMSLTTQLAPEGIQVLMATTPETALATVRVENPDLVLLGTSLPDLDVIQLSLALRRAGHGVPVVLMTPQMETREAAESFASGVTDHLIVPFTAAHVRSRVRRWLQRRKVITAKR
jgi:phosphoribosyl 1,2-cyclic phosphodiesterase/CheY-like chemotaxis protein